MIERLEPQSVVRGVLHVIVAYDWGDEVDLARAASLASGRRLDLERRPRTPTSVAYRPTPLNFSRGTTATTLPDMPPCAAAVSATVFDFAAINLRLDVPLESTVAGLRRLAGDPAALQALVRSARDAAESLHRELLPAIKAPAWRDFSEEYFVFHFDPATLPDPQRLVERHADWLAALLRLENDPLSRDEIDDALSRRLSYAPHDLVLVDWAAAVVIDRECEESLRAIEFANVQLLEFRHLDRRLDDALIEAYGLIHSLAGSRRPLFGRSQHGPLRVLGDIKIETDVLFERSANALKLVGDQYLARLYRQLAHRFHLDEWASGIRQSLDVVESVYRILADQAAAGRIELMELIVIGLIAVEIVISLTADH